MPTAFTPRLIAILGLKRTVERAASAVEERPSIAALYAAHAQRVGRWAARLGEPGFDVEDIVQEVFLVAHRRLSEFRPEARATTWLFGITRNVVRGRRRKRWGRERSLGEDETPELPDLGPSPADALERRQTTERVYRILATMNDRYREHLILFELEGLSGEAIAELTGTKVSNVWVTLSRARAQFLERTERLEREEGGR